MSNPGDTVTIVRVTSHLWSVSFAEQSCKTVTTNLLWAFQAQRTTVAPTAERELSAALYGTSSVAVRRTHESSELGHLSGIHCDPLNLIPGPARQPIAVF